MHTIKECWWKHRKILSLLFLRTLLTPPEWTLEAQWRMSSPPRLAKPGAWPGLTSPPCGVGTRPRKIASGASTSARKLLVWWSLRASVLDWVQGRLPIFCSSVVFWNPLLICSKMPQTRRRIFKTPCYINLSLEAAAFCDSEIGKKTKSKQNLIFWRLYVGQALASTMGPSASRTESYLIISMATAWD